MRWPMPESAPVTSARRPSSRRPSTGRGVKLGTSIAGRLPGAAGRDVNGSSPRSATHYAGRRPRSRRRRRERTREGPALAYFKDEQEVYQYIGKLFSDLADDDELGPKFRKANTIVQYQYRNPESLITVKMLDGQDGQVDLGATELEPEVVMTMEADTAHRFWLGKINVTVALARGQMKAKGPVAKILKLVPLVKPVFPRYRTQLEEAGRNDLVEAA